MTITRNINGSISVSTIIDNYLVTRTYFGYTIKQAKLLFKGDTDHA